MRRDNGVKNPISLDTITTTVAKLLETIQSDMFTKAQTEYFSRMKQVTKWEDVVPTLDSKSIAIIPWCEEEACEDDIKERSGKA